MRVDGRTDGRDEANSRFSQVCERAFNYAKVATPQAGCAARCLLVRLFQHIFIAHDVQTTEHSTVIHTIISIITHSSFFVRYFMFPARSSIFAAVTRTYKTL
jgi:hypothetical protein